MPKVNLREKFALSEDYWNPRVVGELNDSFVKLAKFKGEFVWHQHPDEDELFLVIRGEVLIRLRSEEISLTEGEFLIVPKGVEHAPSAPQEAWVLLFELKSTRNTGNVSEQRTRTAQERI